MDATDGVAKDVALLPGQYNVLVAPRSPGSTASTLSTLSIDQNGVQGGKAVTVDVVSSLGGSVLIPSGSSAVVGRERQRRRLRRAIPGGHRGGSGAVPRRKQPRGSWARTAGFLRRRDRHLRFLGAPGRGARASPGWCGRTSTCRAASTIWAP
ncbi:MAG: hypothetical protein U0263_36135 [Polyangiaceae bacterium]